MKCKIDGCNKDVAYKERGICQMHYFRHMRNGYYELKREKEEIIYGKRHKKYRYQNPAGYELINEPSHPLADKRGYVYEHRFVYFNETDDNPSRCAMCGDEINWGNLHIDHIDNDVTNNNKENLRAVCRPCNVFRGHTPESMGEIMITIDERTMNPEAWSRQDGVQVTGSTIRRRKRNGYADYDSVYGVKKTHTAKERKPQKKKYDEIRGI